MIHDTSQSLLPLLCGAWYGASKGYTYTLSCHHRLNIFARQLFTFWHKRKDERRCPFSHCWRSAGVHLLPPTGLVINYSNIVQVLSSLERVGESFCVC